MASSAFLARPVWARRRGADLCVEGARTTKASEERARPKGAAETLLAALVT
jgi:hypothetical protein